MTRASIAGVLFGAAAFSGLSLSAANELKVGDPAPAFSLPGSDGVTYRLADYKGHKPVVLAWFAKAFTSG